VNLTGIQLVEVGDAGLPRGLLKSLAGHLERHFGTPCHPLHGKVEAAFAELPERNQYHSHRLLARLAGQAPPDGGRLLGVTALDLCVPIFSYVFGEAQLAGPCAIVSLFRLREEFYGLPPNPALLEERLLKEAVHELGHTLGLQHCDDWQCVMSASHTVERLDLKGQNYCWECGRELSLTHGP
jgi:archaemetzincin